MAVRRRDGVYVFLFATGFGLLLFAYRYLELLTSGHDEPIPPTLINELTGAYTAGLLFYLAVRPLARRLRLDGPGWRRALGVHALALPAYAATATTSMWISRSLLYPAFGLGPFDYGRMPLRYFMELPVQLLGYVLMAGGVTLAERYREERERALATERLEAQLNRSRLENLELQLQPHFLFNALNTISSTMYDDPAAADEMIGHLAELLRASLQREKGQEVHLRDELGALDHYLSLMCARLGDGLAVTLDVEPEALDAMVPSFLLQPLVENAVRHGRASAVGEGRIQIRAVRAGDCLKLEVRDEGRQGAAPAPGRGFGLGLALTRQRLELLYAGRHSIQAGPLPEGGFLVSLELPTRAG